MPARRSKKKNFEYSLPLFSMEFTPLALPPKPKPLRINSERWCIVRIIERLVDSRFETIVWFYFDIYLHYDDYSDYDLYFDLKNYVPLLTYPF